MIIKSFFWILSLLFALIAVLLLGMGGYFQAFLIICIALILLPPFRLFLKNRTGKNIPWWVHTGICLLLWGAMISSLVLNPAKSIYKSDYYKTGILNIYDEKLSKWPVPYKSEYVKTQYGDIHVIISGPENGFPVLLLNASGLSGWSWIHNIEELSRNYRCYAIDNIGEGGKSRINSPGNIPENGKEIADFYSGICDKLEIRKAHVIGASIGGYIAAQFALNAPDRVGKMVLLGPMGFGSTLKTVITMTIAQGFPVKKIQDATFRWAFGNSETVEKSFGRWFRLYMKGVIPTPVRPSGFSPEELGMIKSPVLAYFGAYDKVIGDARKAEILAENIPDIKTKIINSGHVIAAEKAEIINRGIIEFLEN